jgi:hypothetical protein
VPFYVVGSGLWKKKDIPKRSLVSCTRSSLVTNTLPSPSVLTIFSSSLLFTVDFENGTLDVPEGTTLRTFLSKVLHCDPMRITKKYTGNSSIGKRTFTALPRTSESGTFIDASQRVMRELRHTWLSRLLLAEQWNNRKVTMLKASNSSSAGTTTTSSSAVGSGDDGDYVATTHTSATATAAPINAPLVAASLEPFVQHTPCSSTTSSQLEKSLQWLQAASLHNQSSATTTNSSISDLDGLLQEGEMHIPTLVNQVLLAQYDPATAASEQTVQNVETLQRLLQSLLHKRPQQPLTQAQQPLSGLSCRSTESVAWTESESCSAKSLSSLDSHPSASPMSFTNISTSSRIANNMSTTSSRKRKATATSSSKVDYADLSTSSSPSTSTATSNKFVSLLPLSLRMSQSFSVLSAADSTANSNNNSHSFDRKSLPLEERLRAATVRQHVLPTIDYALKQHPYNEIAVYPSDSLVSEENSRKRSAAYVPETTTAADAVAMSTEEGLHSSIVSAAEALLGLIHC